MITIEFTPAEIVHIMADCPPTPMVGPRFTGWCKITAQARKLDTQMRTELRLQDQEEEPE